LEVNQININDPLLNLENGSNITEIKTGTDYPDKNFLALAEITG